jgi:hypothetical protein
VVTREQRVNILHELSIDRWDPSVSRELQREAITALERGEVLFFPRLGFEMSERERQFLSPLWSDGKSKNVSLDGQRALRGARGPAQDLERLRAAMARFADQATRLVTRLLPDYVPTLRKARTSLRLFEVEQRVSSFKKDDKRLHVDAFPSSPTGGERILRVFNNVNPEGRPRVWRLGEPFADMAQRYLPRVHAPWPASAWLLRTLRVTKGKRTRYDHVMLQLHDLAKADAAYQRDAPQQEAALPPGSTWIVFSDQVLHAAMSGQYMLEQTYHLPLAGLRDEQTAPLRVLERLMGKRLSA